MNAIDTRHIDLANWAAANTYLLSRFGAMPTLLGDNWRAWGNIMATNPTIASVGTPMTNGFSDWQSWAREFNQSIRLLPG